MAKQVVYENDANPGSYACSLCKRSYHYPFTQADYYFGSAAQPGSVLDSERLPIPTEPVWCQTCDSLSLAEHIEPTRVFEDALALFRGNHDTKYPVRAYRDDYLAHGRETDDYSREYREEMLQSLTAYLTWRTTRRDPARALCCGSHRFFPLNAADIVLKHEGCGGLIRPQWSWYIGGYCGWDQHERLDRRLYSSEGELLGMLTHSTDSKDGYHLEADHYPPDPVDAWPMRFGQSWAWLQGHTQPKT